MTWFSAWAVAVVRWSIATYNMLSYDRPWWAGISFTLSILEINTGLICACAAALGPLWKMSYFRVKGWSSRGSSEGSTWPTFRHSQSWNRSRKASYVSQHLRHKSKPSNAEKLRDGLPQHAPVRTEASGDSLDDEYRLLELLGPHIHTYISTDTVHWRDQVV